MEITSTTETVTVKKYTLTLTEAELTAALVDPSAMQQALRDARGEHARGRHGARNIVITGKRRGKKEQSPRSPKVTSAKTGAFTKEPCAKCGKLISRSQIKNHMRSCRGTAAAASA